MPRRGDLVGDAYVRIWADTTFMKQAIRRDLKKAGEEGAESFFQGFDEAVDRSADARLRSVNRTLVEGITGGSFDAAFKKSGERVESFTKKTRDYLLLIDRDAKNAGLTLKHMDDALATLGKWEQGALLAQQLRDIEEELRENEAALDDQWRAAERVNKQYDAMQRLHLEALAEDVRRTNKEMTDLHTVAKQMNTVFDKRNKDHIVALRMESERTTRAMNDLHVEALALNKEWDKMLPLMEEAIRLDRLYYNGAMRTGRAQEHMAQNMDRANNRIAVFLGKGSRNNFLNIFGATVGNLSKMFTSFPMTMVSKISTGIGEMVGKFRLLTEGGQTASAALRTMGTTLAKSVGPGLAGLGISLAVLARVLPAIASGMTLLGGALTAVIGAIGVGLVGGLLAAAPLVVALGAAVAAIIPVVSGMGDMFEKGADKLQPQFVVLRDAILEMKTALEDVRKTAGAALAGALAPMVRDTVLPLMREMTEVLTGVFTHLDLVFNNPRMQGFLNVWEQSLPRAFESIGMGINNMLAGFVAFFTPILPFAERLAQNFEDLMKRFSDWAQSAAGQNSIADWMDTAWKAAGSLWGILTNVASALGKVFTSGTEGAGQDFLTYLENVTDRFDKWLDTPEGQAAMKQFWVDVRDTMVTVKDIIEDIGRFFDEMDTEQARQDFKDFADAVETVAGWLDRAAEGMNALNTYMTGDQGLDETTGAMESFGESVNTALTGAVTAAYEWATGFGQTINDGLDSALQAVVDWAGGWLTSTGEAMTQFKDDFNAKFDEVVAGVVPKLETLALNILTGLLFLPALLYEVFAPVGQTIYDAMASWGESVNTKLTEIKDAVVAWAEPYATVVTAAFETAKAHVATKMEETKTTVGTAWNTTVTVAQAALSTYVAEVGREFTAAKDGANRLSTDLHNFVTAQLDGVVVDAKTLMGSFKTNVLTPMGELPGKARTSMEDFGGTVNRKLTEIAGAAGRWFSPITNALVGPIKAAWEQIGTWIDNIKGLFSNALQSARDTARNIMNVVPGVTMASGGVLYGPTHVLAGESGPEAIVPLHRPLSQVDPAVRELSAIAQGLRPMARGGVAAGGGIVIHPGAIVVQTPLTDPALIAEAVLDRIVQFA